MKNNQGFTLVEIIICMGILIGIAYFAMSSFKGTVSASKSTELKASSLNTAIEIAIKAAQTPQFFFNFSSSSTKLYEVQCYSTQGIQLTEPVFKSGDINTLAKDCFVPGTNRKLVNLMFELHQKWIDANNIEIVVFIFDKADNQTTRKTFKIVAKNAL